MNIIIGGDVVPSGKNIKLFESGEVEKILGSDLFDIWNASGYRFFNLECPITNSNKKIKKFGPNIKCSPSTINGINKLFPTCVMLANNHILDYSKIGLTDTTRILDKNKINWVGVGENINATKKIFRFSCDNKKIVVYNCCEHEFSVATQDSCGANPYDANYIENDLKIAKEKSDFLIVIYHGGKEYYRYPSPQLQKRCQRMIEYGANLVICQHSHCIGCEENFKGGKIIYGQGNFIFNSRENEFWRTSLLVNIDFSNGQNINYIPIMQTEYGTRLASSEEAEKILRDFLERSENIRNNNFVSEEYKKYAQKELDKYLITINRNIMLRAVRKLCPYLFSKIKFDYVAILNVVECEAHNELFVEGLKNRIEDRKNEK